MIGGSGDMAALKGEYEADNTGTPIPCPFCGRDDVGIQKLGVVRWAVTCCVCEIHGEVRPSAESAVECWNRRAGIADTEPDDEDPQPVGRCGKCGALWYSDLGFCGGCGATW